MKRQAIAPDQMPEDFREIGYYEQAVRFEDQEEPTDLFTMRADGVCRRGYLNVKTGRMAAGSEKGSIDAEQAAQCYREIRALAQKLTANEELIDDTIGQLSIRYEDSGITFERGARSGNVYLTAIFSKYFALAFPDED